MPCLTYELWQMSRSECYTTLATPAEAKALTEAASGDVGEAHAVLRLHVSAIWPADPHDNVSRFRLFVSSKSCMAPPHRGTSDFERQRQLVGDLHPRTEG